MSNNDILYRHLRDDNNIPYATLAMKYQRGIAYIAGSLCSREDQFSRRRGREIATHRLNALMNGKTPNQLVLACGVDSFEEAEEIFHEVEIFSVKQKENLYKYKIMHPFKV